MLSEIDLCTYWSEWQHADSIAKGIDWFCVDSVSKSQNMCLHGIIIQA